MNKNHLYYILDDFVKVVPESITLNVQLSGGKLIKIENKPLPMGTGIYAFPQNDDNKEYIEEIEKTEFKDLDVEHEGIRYKSYLLLPTEKAPSDIPSYWKVLLDGNAYCVDGIKVDDSFVRGIFLNVTKKKLFYSILNFVGAERPQLSISREKIVKYNPDKYEGKIKELLGKIVKQGIDKTAEYIAEKNVKPGSKLYEGIWNSFFKRFEDVPVDIVAQQLSGESIKDLVIPLPEAFTTSQMTFGDFWGQMVCFEDYHMFKSKEPMDYHFLRRIIDYRISHLSNVSFEGNKAIITGYLPNEKEQKYPIASNGDLFQNYDIVASLYPFTSVSFRRLFPISIYNLLDLFSEQIIMVIMGYSNNKNSAIVDLFKNDLRRIYRKIDKNYGYSELYSYLAEFFNKNRKSLLTEIIGKQIDRLRRYVYTTRIITFYIPISREQLKKSRLDEFKDFYSRLFDTNDSNSDDRGLSVILFLHVDESTPFDLHVIPGCWTRQELINMIPNDVWNRLPSKNYQFTDGTKVVRKKAQP